MSLGYPHAENLNLTILFCKFASSHTQPALAFGTTKAFALQVGKNARNKIATNRFATRCGLHLVNVCNSFNKRYARRLSVASCKLDGLGSVFLRYAP